MKVIAEKIVAVVLSMAVLLISSRALANQQTQGEPPGDAKREVSTKAPDLADIIPLATKLSGRLAALENRIKGGLDSLCS